MIRIQKLYLLAFALTSFLEGVSQSWEKAYTDTTVFSLQEAAIDGRKYIAFLREEVFKRENLIPKFL